jgi:hypothetical protein
LFSVEMPDDVTSLLATAEQASPAERTDSLILDAVSYSFVTTMPVQPAITPTVKVDYVDEKPATPVSPAVAALAAVGMKGTWDGDRQAALRAGSGHY